MTGCVTSGAAGHPFAEGRDDFQLLQQSAGLKEGSWHSVGEELETDVRR